MWSQELYSVVFVGPFQLGRFYDSVISLASGLLFIFLWYRNFILQSFPESPITMRGT